MQWSGNSSSSGKWGNSRGHVVNGGGGGRGGAGGQRPAGTTVGPSLHANGGGGGGGGVYRQPPQPQQPPPAKQQQQQQEEEEEARFEVGPGLNNLGNTCYLNSVLQVLVHAPLLHEAMLRSRHTEECARRRQGFYCLLCKLESFIKAIRQGKAARPPQAHYGGYGYGSASYGSPAASVSPTFLSDHLRKLSPSLMLGRQEDAAELLRLLRDKLQLAWTGHDAPEFKVLPVKAKPYPFSLFGGTLQSIVKCLTCGDQSRAADPMEDLVLEIVHNGRPLGSLKEALACFMQIETLDGNNRYRCEKKCRNTLQPAMRRFLIGRVPPLLCIQLKRFSFFSHFGSKLSHAVEFPQRIDFTPHCSLKYKREEHLKKVEGELFGVIVHQGMSLNSGHYYAYVKSPSSPRWFQCNDAWVQPASLQEALGQQKGAYMLFYRTHYVLDPNRQPAAAAAVPAKMGKKPRLDSTTSNGSASASSGSEEEGGAKANGGQGNGKGSGNGHHHQPPTNGVGNGHGPPHAGGGGVLIGPQLPPGMARPPPPPPPPEGDGGGGGGAMENGSGRKRPLPSSAAAPALSLSALEERVYALLRRDAVAQARREWALGAVEARLAAPPSSVAPAVGLLREVAGEALLSGAPGEGVGVLSDPELLERAVLEADTDAGANGQAAKPQPQPPPSSGGGGGTGV